MTKQEILQKDPYIYLSLSEIRHQEEMKEKLRELNAIRNNAFLLKFSFSLVGAIISTIIVILING